MKEDVVWTDLTATAIAVAMSELRDDEASAYTAKQLLEQEGRAARRNADADVGFHTPFA